MRINKEVTEYGLKSGWGVRRIKFDTKTKNNGKRFNENIILKG